MDMSFKTATYFDQATHEITSPWTVFQTPLGDRRLTFRG